jgi:hypothetical protein
VIHLSPKHRREDTGFWLKVWDNLDRLWPSKIVVYAGLFAWGIVNLFSHDSMPVLILMSGTIYNLWLGLHLAAPTMTWIGQFMRLRDPPDTRALQGWTLQLAGDAAVLLIASTGAYAFWQFDDIAEFDMAYRSLVTLSVVLVAMATAEDIIAVIYFWLKVHRHRSDVHR